MDFGQQFSCAGTSTGCGNLCQDLDVNKTTLTALSIRINVACIPVALVTDKADTADWGAETAAPSPATGGLCGGGGTPCSSSDSDDVGTSELSCGSKAGCCPGCSVAAAAEVQAEQLVAAVPGPEPVEVVE